MSLRTYLRAPAAGGQRRSQVVVEITTRANLPASSVGLAEFGSSAGAGDCAQLMARQIFGLFGGVIEAPPARGGIARICVSFEI
jgi:hypothetical protein